MKKVRRTLLHSLMVLLLTFYVLGAAVVASGCSPANQESWTLCVYLCGSNLESKHSRATQTLDELKSANIPANVTVVLETGGARSWHTDDMRNGGIQRFVLEEHQLKNVESLPGDSMGSPETLASFLEYCATEYPSDHSMVVLWDHGGGPNRGVCFDEMYGYDALTLADIGKAFSWGVEARNGAPYDIVGLDACLMASLETAAMLKDDAAYMVASQNIEPGAGWDYTQLPQQLAATDKDGITSTCTAICDGYRNKCVRNGKGDSITLSAVDLSKINRVETALNAVVSAETQDPGDLRALLNQLVMAARSAESFGAETDREGGASNLYDLAEMAQKGSASKGSSSKAFEELSLAVKDAVICSVYGVATADAAGLSIYYPADYNKSALASYCASTPLEDYAKQLEQLYSVADVKVEFSDRGSLNDENQFCVSIPPDLIGGIYELHIVVRGTEGEPHDEENMDIESDWESGTFAHGMDDSTFALGGVPLDSQMVEFDREDGHIIYTAPISLNGQQTNLRFAELLADDGTWNVKMLGVWSGVDHVTGLSDRSLSSLKPSDVVSCLSSRTGRTIGEVKVDETTDITLEPLSPGVYDCWYVAIDLYGNEIKSDVLTYRVSDMQTTEFISIEQK